MDMTPERWNATNEYLRAVIGRPDEHLSTLMERAVAAGLPDIAVSPDVGRLLLLLAGMCGPDGGRARRALELGTLAGYSAIWIARGMDAGGRLITVEPEAKHADFAERMFAEAGVAERVEVRRDTGLNVLDALRSESAEPFDFVFIDAIKTEYPECLDRARPLVRVGGLVVADNTLGSGSWWIDAAPGESPERDAADRFNRMLADDPAWETACVPLREGLTIARRVR